MHADSEPDRIALGFGEHAVEMVDIAGDHRGRVESLAAGGRRIGIEAEQSKQPVAEILVGLAAGFHHGLRHGRQKPVDDEHGIERQAFFRHLGRAAHVDEHAHRIALLAEVDPALAVHKGSVRLRGENGHQGDVGLRPQLAGETN